MLIGQEVICMQSDKVIHLLILELKLYLGGHECAAESVSRYRRGIAK
jgi:hypothetical protein